MSGAIEVGTEVKFHSGHGELLATVVECEEGKEGGDYYLAVLATTKSQESQEWGNGPVFNTWSVVGEERGAFSVA